MNIFLNKLSTNLEYLHLIKYSNLLSAKTVRYRP